MPVKYRTLPELSAQDVTRFWNQVKIQTDGCWLWQGAKSNREYGVITFTKQGCPSVHYTHRIAYYIYNAVKEIDCFVCHTCDVPVCVNPFHLFLGTSLDNVRDMIAKGRSANFKGEGGAHKLTEKEVKYIRQEFTGELGQQARLAERFGVHPVTIHYVISRKSWKHI